MTATVLPVPAFLSANKPLGPPRLWSSRRSSPLHLAFEDVGAGVEHCVGAAVVGLVHGADALTVSIRAVMLALAVAVVLVRS